MPFVKISGLVIVMSDVCGRVVFPTQFLHRSSETVNGTSDIPRLYIELIPVFFRASVQSSF
eukprot:2271305-Heterocapsa_arctica.AAC.1